MTATAVHAVIIFLSLVLGFFVFSQNTRSLNHRFFAVMALLASSWATINLLYDLSQSLFWLQSSYACGALVIISALLWVINFTNKKSGRLESPVLIFVSIFFCVGSFIPDFIIKSYSSTSNGHPAVGSAGLGLIFYSAFFILLSAFIIWKLHKSLGTTNDLAERKRIQNVLYGISIALGIILASSFILPFFSILTFGIIDNAGFLIFLIFVAYSITKHRLFNIRVIAIELVTFGLWMTILIRTLLATTQEEVLIDVILLFITIIFGIMLIRGTLHEITQRERIEKLAADLQKAYASLEDLNDNLEIKVEQQTQEIKRAYEVEKKARAELEKLDKTKNELITSAQHNLRTPLTALKWQLETIRKTASTGSKTELEETLRESEESVARLSSVLEDFLSITDLKVNEKNNLSGY